MISLLGRRAPDISIYPVDPVVCTSSNVTFHCTSKTDTENQISFMTGKHHFKKVYKLEKLGDQSVKFTLLNIGMSENDLLVCCTLGDYCNSSKVVVSLITVKRKLQYPCIFMYIQVAKENVCYQCLTVVHIYL